MQAVASTHVANPEPVMDKPLMHYGRRVLDRLAPGAEQSAYRLIDIDPLTPHFGAVLGGVDLTRPISDELATELRQALLEWKVIFFRGQTGFTAEHQLALSGVWGPPEANPFFAQTGTPGISRLAKDAKAAGNKNIWHSDHSFMVNPRSAPSCAPWRCPPRAATRCGRTWAPPTTTCPMASRSASRASPPSTTGRPAGARS